MPEQHKEPVDRDHGSGAVRMPVVVYLAAVALCAAATLVRTGGWNTAPPPYAWWDVVIVQFVCALPLAAWLAGPGLGRFRTRTFAVGGLVLLGMGVWLWVELADGLSTVPLTAARWLPPIRSGPPLLCVTALLFLARGLYRPAHGSGPPQISLSAVLLSGMLGVFILVALPALYVEARCRNDVDRLKSWLEQSRSGDAACLAHGIVLLDPNREIDGRPLRRLLSGLERNVRELEVRIAVPLEANATDDQLLERARDLAMLGREDEALIVLDGLKLSEASVEALNLHGTIHETREEWELAGAWFTRSRGVAVELLVSPEQQAGLADAIRGDAYAKRMLGRNADAEAAYLDLLKVAPTAETHFLLAQFYEDTQQSAAARRHARTAVALAPDRYGAAADELIDHLTTAHFGCAGVLFSERGQAAAAHASLTEPEASAQIRLIGPKNSE